MDCFHINIPDCLLIRKERNLILWEELKKQTNLACRQKTTKSKTFLNILALKSYILYTLNSYLNTRNAGHVVHTFHPSIYRRQRLAWST